MTKLIITVLFFYVCLGLRGQTFDHLYSPSDTILKQGRCYRTWNIIFVFNRPQLMDTTNGVLDSVATFMKNNSNIAIEIGVHADIRGTNKYNSNITQQRATTLANYMINKGIQSQRILAKGYGKVKPLYTDTTNASHNKLLEKNKRVEFTIISTDQ